MSEHQKQLKLQIEKEKDYDKLRNLKATRNRALHTIQRIHKQEKNDHFLELIEEINNSKDDSRRMFQAVKTINRKKENSVFVNDENGNLVVDTKSKIKEISKHFEQVFQKGNIIDCPDIKPQKLSTPFTTEEIQKAIKSLKNNKSAGCDLLRSEHLKNAPEIIHEHIADLLNNVAETGEFPKEIKLGLLTPLQKPGKPKGPPENLRPIILLSILRKILAICVIRRIDSRVRYHIIPPPHASRVYNRKKYN